MTTFDLPSFFIGFLIGLILMLLLVWISWFTRTGAFVNCPVQVRPCTGEDYYNDPGEAIANAGVTAGQILFIVDGKMYYKRVPKNGTCAPEGNQVVRIAYPQYCKFSGTGIAGVTGIDRYFNANLYDTTTAPPFYPVTTDQNCTPKSGQIVTEGIPILEWNAAYLPQRTQSEAQSLFPTVRM